MKKLQLFILTVLFSMYCNAQFNTTSLAGIYSYTYGGKNSDYARLEVYPETDHTLLVYCSQYVVRGMDGSGTQESDYLGRVVLNSNTQGLLQLSDGEEIYCKLKFVFTTTKCSITNIGNDNCGFPAYLTPDATLTKKLNVIPTNVNKGKLTYKSIIGLDIKNLSQLDYNVEYISGNEERPTTKFIETIANAEDNNSDYAIMLKQIKEKVQEWLKKGEFEKSDDYTSRITNDAKKSIDEIILSIAQNQIEEYNMDIKAELGQYNADLEQFPITTKFKNKLWSNTISIPIADAQRFKTYFTSNTINKIKSNDNKRWALINNYWSPSEYDLDVYTLGSYTVKLSESNKQNDFIINSKDLDIENTINDYNFSWVESEKKITEIENDTIYYRADIMPSYVGGVPALKEYLASNLRYPSLARENGLKGKVIVKFYVDTDGSIKEPTVLKDGVGGGCADEAVRVIKSMPKWVPGIKNSKQVKVYFTLPITFGLN